MGGAQVVPAAVTERDGSGHRPPGTVRVAPDPQHASADHQQVRSWIVKLLEQGRGPGILLIEAHPSLEMLLRRHELPELVARVQQCLVAIDLENTIIPGITQRQELDTKPLGRAQLCLVHMEEEEPDQDGVHQPLVAQLRAEIPRPVQRPPDLRR